MRSQHWLMALGLCLPSFVAEAQDSAPPPATEIPVVAPPPAAPAQAADTAIYPQTTDGTGTQGYPTANDQAAPGQAQRYGTDTYITADHALQIVPENNPYRLSVHQKYPLKVDLQLEVPVPLTDRNSARPGFGFSALFGWDLGFLVPTVGMGWSWAALTLPTRYGGADRNLKRFHMNVGLVAEFENKSIVTPVIGGFVDFNWWHVAGDDAIACGGYYYWGCYQVENYRYTTGFSMKAGLDFRFSKNDRFTLGTGVLPQFTFSGGPFTRSEWWLSPYAVFSVRN